MIRNIVIVFFTFFCGMAKSQMSMQEYRVALVLPFKSEGVQSNLTEAMLDYFEGFKMGTAYLESEGLRLKLYTFDCEKDSLALENILAHPDLKTMDVIVGPVYEKDLTQMESFCKKHDILLVSPLKFYTPKKEESTVINFFCPDSLRIASIAEKCARLYPNYKIYMVQDGTEQSRSTAALMRAKFRAMRHPHAKVITLLEGRLVPAPPATDSIIFISTISAPQVKSILVRQIKNRTYSRVVAYLDWNSSLSSTFLLNEPKVIYPEVNFVSYYDSFATNFRNGFFDTYLGEPSKYAYIGYDQATYLCYGLMTFGKNFCEHLPDAEYRGLINVIHLRKTENGIVNMGLNYLQIIEEERLEFAP